jgi:hypothetical protein
METIDIEAKEVKKSLVLDSLDTKILTDIGKAHYLILSLLEAAERDVKGLPLEVSANAKVMNQEALGAIAAHLEAKEGTEARDIFLKAVTGIFEPKKRKSKAKDAVKNSPALKRKRNESKKA